MMAALEISGIILPPNKQLEATYEFSKTPVIYDYLMFMDFNENGNVILGSSNITGTFWEGTLSYFKSLDHLTQFDSSNSFIYMTTSDGKFVNHNTIALAEDTGVLNILYVDDDYTMQNMNYFRNSKKISQIATWDKSSKVLTGAGKSVAVWDINSVDQKPCFSSNLIHLEDVNTVDSFKNDTNAFVSGGCDRKALLWDTRTRETPLVLYTNEFCALTRMAINQRNPNYIVIGTQAGDIYLVDKRNPSEFLSSVECFKASINALAFNDSNLCAVGGNTNEVLVYNCDGEQLRQLYNNCDHEGFVKDLKWRENTLVSCGFGKRQVIKHNILINELQ